MKQKEYLYVTFNTTTDSIEAESLFKSKGIPGRLVIIPRELSAGCGMAWRSEPNWKDLIEKTADENSLSLKQLAII
ncbi:DUF3343 domain-containing protein [Facklamia sp. DSM 111018]|uniref:DUF3343 domain-containing protein n=1 Tax=Facklamia lactis TaxID=2749967 RepID=A0ABS0LPY6_9LACT|nr:DUF3343 domain-containing protein [Facklamia lactis]MBG9980249.1 DUF3343 domain-containing protein [Facklamia lactis]MBG9986052.1 DUF3343 domain-containing protein [Facklamia lactis]